MVTIKLDKERPLMLTFRGMKLFEEKTHQSLLHGLNLEKLSVDGLYALLWVLLIGGGDKDIELEKVMELADNVDATEIIKRIGETLKGNNAGQ